MSKKDYHRNVLDSVDVQWQTLAEVCDFKNGFAFKSSLFKENGLPIIRIANIDGKTVNLSHVKYFNPQDYAENIDSYQVKNGHILIAMSGATTGKIGFYQHKDVAYLNQRVGKFLPKKGVLNNRYLYHYLLSKVETIYLIAGGGAQPNLSSHLLMSKIFIPIPYPKNPERSLKVQDKIASSLELSASFNTQLTTELVTELEARQKQYNYYQNKLLKFEKRSGFSSEDAFFVNTVAHENLGNVCKLLRGKTLTKKDLVPGNIPVIAGGRKPAYYHNESNREGETIAVSNSGCYTGFVSYWSVPVFLSDSFSIEPDNRCLRTKYVFYFLKNLQSFIYTLKRGSGVPHVHKEDILKLKIPLFSLKRQERIVALLDKFSTLSNSMSSTLPHEIELRQKQYAYYRELLFSFSEHQRLIK